MALVSECPKNKTEISKASKRLNCGNDSYGNNQYICLPNEEKTSLVELCFDGIIGLNERGSCLEESVGKVIQHNCSRFLYGCPDSEFDTNEVYKYPACFKINKEYHCYVSDPFCPPIEPSKGTDNTFEVIIYPCIGVLVAVGIIAVICLYLHKKQLCRRYRKENPHKEKALQVLQKCKIGSNGKEACHYTEASVQHLLSPSQETGSDFCEERPESELLLDFISSKLQRTQFTKVLALLSNQRIHGTETEIVRTSEECFKFLHDWYCQNNEMNHMTELKKALHDAQLRGLVKEIENFSKANIVFDPNKIKQPEREVTTHDISFMARNLGINFRRVLRFLDIKQITIEQTEEEYKDTINRVYRPLVNILPKLTRQSLCNALCYVNQNKTIQDLNSRWNTEDT